jgi:hypothetical protein
MPVMGRGLLCIRGQRRAHLLYLSMGLRHPCNEYSLEPQGPGCREEGADVIVGACMHGARQWLLLENI